MDSPSSFRMSIDTFESTIQKYDQFHGSKEDLININNALKSELGNISWLIDTLDPSNAEHMYVFREAQMKVHQLNISQIVQNLNKNKNSNDELGNEIKQLSNMNFDVFLPLLEKMASKIDLWISKSVLDPSLAFNPQKSNLTLSSFSPPNAAEPQNDTYYNTFLYSLTLLNPISWPVSGYFRYTGSKTTEEIAPLTPEELTLLATGELSEITNNDPKTLKSIIDTLCGRFIDTKEDYVYNVTESIIDHNNPTVKAPVAFSIDYFRSMSVTLNGERFDNSRDPIKLVRMFYELAGHKGGNRLMLLCTQALMSNPMLKHQDCHTKYADLFPPDIIIQPFLGQGKFGLNFEIVVDPKTNKVEFIGKFAFKIKANEREHPDNSEIPGVPFTDYTVYTIYKIQANIPYNVLINDNPEDHASEILIKEQISSPIINNEPLVFEVLKKF